MASPMAREFTSGPAVTCTQASGEPGKSTDKVHSPGKVVTGGTASMKTTSKKQVS